MKKEKNVSKESEPSIAELAPDMRLYFNEMFRVLRRQGSILSANGMNMGRTGIDMVRELLINSVERIGKLDIADSEDIWQMDGWEVFEQARKKLDSGEIIPKSKLPKEYEKLFRNIRTLYFLSDEKVKEKGTSDDPSFEGTLVGIPVELIADMLDKIVDTNQAKAKWEEIKEDKNKVREFYSRTGWQVDDLPHENFGYKI